MSPGLSFAASAVRWTAIHPAVGSRIAAQVHPAPPPPPPPRPCRAIHAGTRIAHDRLAAGRDFHHPPADPAGQAGPAPCRATPRPAHSRAGTKCRHKNACIVSSHASATRVTCHPADLRLAREMQRHHPGRGIRRGLHGHPQPLAARRNHLARQAPPRGHRPRGRASPRRRSHPGDRHAA